MEKVKQKVGKQKRPKKKQIKAVTQQRSVILKQTFTAKIACKFAKGTLIQKYCKTSLCNNNNLSQRVCKSLITIHVLYAYFVQHTLFLQNSFSKIDTSTR